MRRVVKVGGSLLTRSDLLDALPQWLARQSPARTLLVVGGGELIDAIRHLDQQRPGVSAEVHWRCVDLLQVTFEIAAKWFERWHQIDAPNRLSAMIDSADPVDNPTLVSVRSFYGRGYGFDLPTDWSTTTDSIAAAMAIEIQAEELVLLKSCRVDPSANLQQLAREGVIDTAFPKLSADLQTIRIEQLTDG